MKKLTKEEETSHDKFQRELSEIPNIELYEQAKDALSKLCSSGGSSFTMHVPPRKTDFDILFSEVLRRWAEFDNRTALSGVGEEENEECEHDWTTSGIYARFCRKCKATEKLNRDSKGKPI